MRMLDEQYTRTPFDGVERMTAWLRGQGEVINPKRIRRLLRLLDLDAIYPTPRLSQPGGEVKRYPYRLVARARHHRRQCGVEYRNSLYANDKNGYVHCSAVSERRSESPRRHR
jgi:putative transposase